MCTLFTLHFLTRLFFDLSIFAAHAVLGMIDPPEPIAVDDRDHAPRHWTQLHMDQAKSGGFARRLVNDGLASLGPVADLLL
jgi:hypothetical protein